jgi:uncharacterized SAM-binding protein YcdF (DUF218 family)
MEDYKILIGLGKALETENCRACLTFESKVTAHALGLACNKRNLDKLIISGGKTAGEEYPSEAELMRDYIYKVISKDIADFAILETESKDTWGNAREIKDILEKDLSQKIGLLTIGYHLPRATKIFEREGFDNLIPLKSEFYLSEPCSTEYLEYLKSPKGIYEQTRERLIQFVTSFSPEAKILRQIAGRGMKKH